MENQSVDIFSGSRRVHVKYTQDGLNTLRDMREYSGRYVGAYTAENSAALTHKHKEVLGMSHPQGCTSDEKEILCWYLCHIADKFFWDPTFFVCDPERPQRWAEQCFLLSVVLPGHRLAKKWTMISRQRFEELDRTTVISDLVHCAIPVMARSFDSVRYWGLLLGYQICVPSAMAT